MKLTSENPRVGGSIPPMGTKNPSNTATYQSHIYHKDFTQSYRTFFIVVQHSDATLRCIFELQLQLTPFNYAVQKRP